MDQETAAHLVANTGLGDLWVESDRSVVHLSVAQCDRLKTVTVFLGK